MANVLVVAEIKEAEPKKITLELLSKGKGIASGLGGSLSCVVIGSGTGGIADKLAPYGATKVYVADGVEKYNTEGFAKILADVIGQESPGLILFGATSQGRDLAPRLAAKLDLGFAADCVDIGVEDGKVTVVGPDVPPA